MHEPFRSAQSFSAMFMGVLNMIVADDKHYNFLTKSKVWLYFTVPNFYKLLNSTQVTLYNCFIALSAHLLQAFLAMPLWFLIYICHLHIFYSYNALIWNANNWYVFACLCISDITGNHFYHKLWSNIEARALNSF